jgi:hypothetical protein
MRLLELTADRSEIRIASLSEGTRRGKLHDLLNALREEGVVSLSDDVLSMNSTQRIKLAERLIHQGRDPKKVSSFLGWREFEIFAEDTLRQNGFQTTEHFTFKSEVGRREIDILAWNDNFLLALDCKHWRRGLSTGRVKEAAHAQVERSMALAKRPDLLHRLRIRNVEKYAILPVILALGELRERIVDGVPVVSVSKLLSFLYGVSPIDDGIQRVKVHGLRAQSQLG